MERQLPASPKAQGDGEAGVNDHPLTALGDLSAQDLGALRLAAQVMAHRAALAGLPRVALFFESIEAETLAEQAAAAQRGRAAPGAGFTAISIGDKAVASDTDRAVIGEYLDLLVANGGLPKPVRTWLSGLRRA